MQGFYRRTIPIEYLRKGDHFIARDTSFYHTFRSGVATMDGHAVSENYGVRTGNDWYIHREVGYINTRWDDKIYAVTLSDSLYARDIPEVLVSDKVYARYLADKQETESILNGTKEERERNSKIRELTESIERAQAELKSAQEKLAALK